jgi:hypothetical protein
VKKVYLDQKIWMHLNSAPRVSFQFEVSATKLGKLGKPFYAPNYLTTHCLETGFSAFRGFLKLE